MSSLLYFLYGFAIFFLIFWSGKWVVHILAITYGKYKLHRKISNLPRDTPLPSVSILKPLMGVDPNLSHNLETFFTMNYPIYELLFCIEDKDDQAVEIVQKLREKYPYIESSLFLGGSNVGVNPKINNMHPGYQAAKYELIMISDSGIKMKEDTLLDMVENMTEKVGLVHQMPFTCDRDGFAATFEKLFFGTIQSRIYLCADLLGINCHTGMSCLMRKPVIDKLGGLSKFGCYLAEDFFIAKSLTENGWKMRISSQPAWQNSGICDIQNFQARLCRWAKLRVAMMPTTILLEPLSECLVVGAFASWSVGLLFSWDPLVFYLIHILMWFLSDWMLLSIVQNGTLSFNKFEFVVGWIFREISGPYLFFNALYDPTIRWRTRMYKLQWGGIAYELQDNKINDTTTSSSSNTNKNSYNIDSNRIIQRNIALENSENYQKYFNSQNNNRQQYLQQQQQYHQQQHQQQQEKLPEHQSFLINQIEKENNCEEQPLYNEACKLIQKQYHVSSNQIQQSQHQQQQLNQYQELNTQQQQQQNFHQNQRSHLDQYQINQIAANNLHNSDFKFCNIKNNCKDNFYREGVIYSNIIKPINENIDSINNNINTTNNININCNNNYKYRMIYNNGTIINNYDSNINTDDSNININNNSITKNDRTINNLNINYSKNCNNNDDRMIINNYKIIEKSDNNVINSNSSTKSDNNNSNNNNINKDNTINIIL